jgi:hypothetical protein
VQIKHRIGAARLVVISRRKIDDQVPAIA